MRSLYVHFFRLAPAAPAAICSTARNAGAGHGRAEVHRGARRARAQPEVDRPRHPARPPGRHHRGQRLREVLPGLRHDLPGRSAALRRVALRLRAPVPRAGHKPRVDHIEGLSPAVAIDQKTVSRNPRSTVGTITEIHDHLRLLYARLGEPHCPACERPVRAQPPSRSWTGSRPSAGGPAGDGARTHRARPQGQLPQGARGASGEGLRPGPDRWRGTAPRRAPRAGPLRAPHIEIVVDRIRVAPEKRGRLAEAVEQALTLAEVAGRDPRGGERHELYSGLLACAGCGIDLPEMEPRSFSFNSPQGACPACDGLGITEQPDARRVIPDPAQSIDEGAVLASHKGGWRLRRRISPEILTQVCDALDIPRDRPFRSLSAAQRELLLEGAGERGSRSRFTTRVRGCATTAASSAAGKE